MWLYILKLLFIYDCLMSKSWCKLYSTCDLEQRKFSISLHNVLMCLKIWSMLLYNNLKLDSCNIHTYIADKHILNICKYWKENIQIPNVIFFKSFYIIKYYLQDSAIYQNYFYKKNNKSVGIPTLGTIITVF